MAAHQAAFEPGDEELWYVATGPGETKLLTLEQLDDLFRLEIIDANTRLWQPGMHEWLPLSVVAGLDEPSKPAKPIAPPPPSARVPRAPAPRSLPPPAAVRPAPLPAPAPLPRAANVVPMHSLPPGRPVPVHSLPPGRPVPVAANTWPAPAPVQALPVRNSFAPPESLRPLAISQPPRMQPRGAGGFGRFLLTLAFLGGVGVTLYRNDVLHQAALSAGQEKTYLKLESALGGPGFGTPRAVAALVATRASLASDTTSSVSTTTSHSSTLSTGSSAVTTTAVREETKPVASQPVQEETKPVASPARETAAHAEREPAAPQPAREKTSNSLAASMAASIGGAKSKPAAPAAAPRAPAPSRTKPAPAEAPSKGLGFQGGKSAYDPLNGKL